MVNNKHLFLAIAVMIFVVAGYIVLSETVSKEPKDKGVIKMNITMSGFEPNIIRAKSGELVTINLINPDNSMHSDGGGFHNFILTADFASVNITVPPQSQKTFSFTPTQAGEYHWYCDICCGGKDNPSMHGILIVA